MREFCVSLESIIATKIHELGGGHGIKQEVIMNEHCTNSEKVTETRIRFGDHKWVQHQTMLLKMKVGGKFEGNEQNFR